jgi:RNA polymerase sigma-70 factor, ECF subfamily
VADLVDQGRAAHPNLTSTQLSAGGVAEFVAARAAAAQAATDPAARAADLYLAGACAVGDPAAIALLDAELPGIVRPALARLGVPRSDDEEIVQRVRIALFSPGPDGTRGITGYSGRGELRSYVRAMAVRQALRRIEREEQPSPDGDEGLALLPDRADSPELRLLKERCRAELRGAFATALAAIAPRARTLLRQHYLDGLTVDVLGRLYRVHRATAARWIDAARADVLREVRRHLRVTLELGPDALESAVALVRSQLDLSLARLLRTSSESRS